MEQVGLEKFKKDLNIKISQQGLEEIEERFDKNGVLLSKYGKFYVVHTMGEDMYLKISNEQYEKIKVLLNDPSVRFVEVKNNLVAVHQITSIEKKSECYLRRM